MNRIRIFQAVRGALVAGIALFALSPPAMATGTLSPERKGSLDKGNRCIELSRELVPTGGRMVYFHPYLEEDEGKTLVSVFLKWSVASGTGGAPKTSPEKTYYCVWKGDDLQAHGIDGAFDLHGVKAPAS